jgi:hypothetical protein
MNIERRDFDKEATTWDEEPARVKLASDIAATISAELGVKVLAKIFRNLKAKKEKIHHGI